MELGELAPAEAAAALARGLRLRTGPFVVQLNSPLPALAAQVHAQYAHHTLAPEGAFCDFHVAVRGSGGLRRWVRPQARFLFDGEEPFEPLPLHHAFPLLEWGLNWCISSHAHQYVILHAAVLERGGRALVLPAPSGSGKSTLCAALAHSGWRLLSDELALLSLDGGQLWPLARPISLKNRSIDVIAEFAPQAALGPRVPDTVKGTVAHCAPPAEAVRRAHEPARPGWVVLPRYVAGAPPQLTPMSPARATMALIDACFNYSLHRAQGFRALGELAGAGSAWSFEYSRLPDAVATFDALAAGSTPSWTPKGTPP